MISQAILAAGAEIFKEYSKKLRARIATADLT